VIPPLRPDRVAAIQARYDASTPGHWHLDPEPHTDPDAVRTTVDGWHHGIGILQFRGWKADENRQFVLNARDDIGQLLADRERYVDRADLVSRIGELELALGGAVGMLFSASVAVSAGLLPDLDRLREGAEELRQVQYKGIGKDSGDAVQAPAGESTQAAPAQVWHVYEEDTPQLSTPRLFTSKAAAEQGSIDLFQEMENYCPDYSWQPGEDESWELLAGSEPVGIYLAPVAVKGEGHDVAPDFFQPGRAYTRGRWTFHCLAVAPRPWNGETRAVGYLSRDDGTGSTVDWGATDWAHAGWTEAGEVR
jgi:hypothetical protein